MDEFKIITETGEPVIIENISQVDNAILRLPGSQMHVAKGSFGKMFFQHFKGEGFNIWFSSYRISKKVKLCGSTDDPILEFHCQYNNVFPAKWKGLSGSPMRHRQFQISYAPYLETSADFESAACYDTFDIHFDRSVLEPYVNFCPQLGNLLDKAEGRIAANFLETILFLTPGMEQAFHEILTYNMYDEWTYDVFRRKVQDILINMIFQVGTIGSLPKFDETLLKKAEEAKKIILSDLSVFDSVEGIARKVGSSEVKLQLAFKHLYGVTVGRFSKDVRMRKAHDLLMHTNETLLGIALMVGYNDAGNFSTAFKNHFGYSPGHVQKRMKK